MFEDNSSLDVQVTSSIHVFPESRQGTPQTVPLSILDSIVSYWARCAGIWYYDPPSNPSSALPSTHLQESLSKTLNAYPQWCGRLSYSKGKPNGGHTNRYRRVHITYNAPDDIGVPFITAKSSKTLAEFLPSTSQRRNSLKAWDASKLKSMELFPEAPLALSNQSKSPDDPNVIIQFTTFACGSIAIGIAITHSLADAQTLSQFAKDWASVSCALFHSAPLPTLSPVFDPQLLDSYAAGNIDAETPDPALQELARKLPIHRFDWYMPVAGQPPPDIPEDFDTTAVLSPSTAIPWDEGDFDIPISHRVLHFSPPELQNIYSIASNQASKISKHDALLAHIWKRIIQAHQLHEDTSVYLDLTFGFRSRLSPPLPATFLGSPITNAAIPDNSSSSSSLSSLANKIRTTLQEFTPEALAAHLHDRAFEVSPQRLWSCFTGRTHTLLTTWIHLGVHEVEFVSGGGKLRYVEPVMPYCDGLVEIMEANGEERGHWTANGVDISVFLEEKAMERLLSDPLLWNGA